MNTTSTKTTDQNTQPWAVQAPYLQQAFSGASDTLNQANGNQYNGQQVAQFTPDQLSNFRNMLSFGSNSTGANTSTNVGINTANMGAGALSSALSGLQGFRPQGGTQSNIDAATAYANNPATDGMITAAMRDANRAVSEQALPGLARGSALSGNAMSSKNDIAQGVIARGLADKTADVSSQIRGEQFNNGLQLAQRNSEANNSSILDALRAAASAGGSAVGTGVGAIGSGIQQQGGLFDIANAGAAGGQQNEQNQINNAKAMSEYGSGIDWQNLQNFMKIVGSNNWGGTGQKTEESTPSMMSTLAGGLGAFNSFFGK